MHYSVDIKANFHSRMKVSYHCVSENFVIYNIVFYLIHIVISCLLAQYQMHKIRRTTVDF